MPTRFYLKIGDEIVGPLRVSEFRQRIASGELPPTAKFRPTDQKRWFKVTQVEGYQPGPADRESLDQPQVSKSNRAKPHQADSSSSRPARTKKKKSDTTEDLDWSLIEQLSDADASNEQADGEGDFTWLTEDDFDDEY